MPLDLGTTILLGAFALMALNRGLLMLPGWDRRPVLFWAVQVANLAACVFMIVHGVPELQGLARYANWVIGLLFAWHIVQNNTRWSAARRARAGQDQAAQRREQVAAALRRGEEQQARAEQQD